jgi:hypothetical protein
MRAGCANGINAKGQCNGASIDPGVPLALHISLAGWKLAGYNWLGMSHPSHVTGLLRRREMAPAVWQHAELLLINARQHSALSPDPKRRAGWRASWPKTW